MRNVLFFYQADCGPCDVAKPVVEAVADEYDYPLTFINARSEANRDLLERYRVRASPTVVVVDHRPGSEKIVGRSFGAFITENSVRRILDR